jgi:hypothetical protein
MTNDIIIEKCQVCKNHVLYQNGYVICDYYKVQEQRIIGKTGKDILCIVNCPKKVDVRRPDIYLGYG